MAHRSIGQERFGFAVGSRSASSLDEIAGLIDWRPIAALLEALYPAAKGEPAWPPLAMFKALLLSVRHDLSDVKLSEALNDRNVEANARFSRGHGAQLDKTASRSDFPS